MDSQKILVTGGCGFIGSNFIRYLLSSSSHRIVNLDKLTYAGNLENLRDVEGHDRYEFLRGDIADKETLEKVFDKGIKAVVNFAAESHVDRSIIDPDALVQTNIYGTYCLSRYGPKEGASGDFSRFPPMRFTEASKNGQVYGRDRSCAQQPLLRLQGVGRHASPCHITKPSACRS